MKAPAGWSAASAARKADDVEAAAFDDLYAAAPVSLARRLGLRVARVAGATALVAPGLPSPMFNRVIGLGLAQPANAADVQALQAMYREAGVGGWWLHWSPVATPADFVASLQADGFVAPARRSWAKVLRGNEPVPQVATDLEIAPVRDRCLLQTTACIAEAFGMPPFIADWLAALHRRPRWRIYAASDGNRVVGGACLYLDADAAWLGMGSIAESHRRRGGQRALMTLRIRDAIAAGCTAIVTETGEPLADEPNPSLANMARCGFAVVASRLNLQAPL